MIQKIPDSQDVLGEGRYGSWMKVLLHGTLVCAKVLKASSMSAVVHEATILSKVRHPNICFLIGLQITQQPFQLLTLLYSIRGDSISIYDTFSVVDTNKKDVVELIRSSLTLSTWLAVMNDVAEALQFIHSKEIVHRDLKSDSVLLTDMSTRTIQGILVDFGKSNYTMLVVLVNIH